MIYVDELRACGAPWRGGVACHMVSDQGLEELRSFAQAIGLPAWWFQKGSIPHFDLSPSLRTRAIRHGAVAVDRRGFVEATRRLRARLAAPVGP
jgi:hypothetical protein